MDDQTLINLATEYCDNFHEGQFRKGNNLPYSTHPKEVAALLYKHGYRDAETQCIALLHDLVEDTNLITADLEKRFGYEIANGVFILSKNTVSIETQGYVRSALGENGQSLSVEHMYKTRLAFARRSVKCVKFADMIVNTRDLVSLSPSGIERKINDAQSFYIPMGKVVAPIMIKELETNIETYLKLHPEYSRQSQHS